MVLPALKEVKLQSITLPTVWQTVVFRNYGYVRLDRIAKTLGCDEETVRAEAGRMGLSDEEFSADFEKSGYLTVIRNNWHLLPYAQLLTLLDFSEEKLALARAAADLVEEGDVIGIDAGSTAVPFAKELASRFSALTVVTYSRDVFDALCENKGITVILMGGEYNDSERYFGGPVALNSLQSIYMQKELPGSAAPLGRIIPCP